MNEPKWQTGSNDSLSRALSAAHELAREEPGARAIQLANDIDAIIGYWVTVGGKHVLSWPHQVAIAAGRPGRHRIEDAS